MAVKKSEDAGRGFWELLLLIAGVKSDLLLMSQGLHYEMQQTNSNNTFILCLTSIHLQQKPSRERSLGPAMHLFFL